ncbi:MAG: hypothetical protein ACQKBW_00730 [Puniceicoccales bacterium]
MLLLTSGNKEDYIGYAKLVGIKTPDGAAFLGFTTEEVGHLFLQATNLSGEQFDFIDAQIAFLGLQDRELEKLQIITFRNEADIKSFVDTERIFPFQEYTLSVSEILN